jgi:hypothetical protein
VSPPTNNRLSLKFPLIHVLYTNMVELHVDRYDTFIHWEGSSQVQILIRTVGMECKSRDGYSYHCDSKGQCVRMYPSVSTAEQV